MSFWKRNGHKYGAVKTADGFPSKLESAVNQILFLRERAGEIRNIRRQHRVDLGFGILWKVDFSFELCATDETVFCEAKGIEDATYKHKVKMWRNGAGPGKLEIWKGDYRRPVLVEVISPRALTSGALDQENIAVPQATKGGTV